MSAPKDHRIIAAAGILTAAGLLALWIRYYLFPHSPADPDTYQFAFDITSPVPDAILSIMLCIAAALLLKGRRPGKILSMAGALYLILLGVLDAGIPWEESIFALSIIDITANGALNLWCVVFGLYTILKLKPGKNKNAPVPTIFSR